MKNLFIQDSISEEFDRSDKLTVQLTNDPLCEDKVVQLLKTIEDVTMLDEKVLRITKFLDHH